MAQQQAILSVKEIAILVLLVAALALALATGIVPAAAA